MANRGRRPGADPNKVNSILSSLIDSPEGLWIRQIAKRTGLHPTTVTKYIEGILAPMVETEALGSESKPLIRVVKLKPIVIQKLEEGQKIGDILRVIKAINSIE